MYPDMTLPSSVFIAVYGAQMVASIINSVLYGVGSFVALQYLKRYGRSDPIIVKGTVFLLLVLSTLETIFTDHQTYSNFVLSFGDKKSLQTIIFSVPAKYFFVFLTTFVAQLFFAGCIWIVSSSLGPRYRLLVVPVVLLAIMQFTAGTIQVVLMSTSGTFRELAKFEKTISKVVAIQGGGTAACDLLITFILVYVFKATSTAAHRTKTILDKLFNYALNRAAATSFCAILTVLLYYFCSMTYYFMVPALATTHLNVISVVSLLSSRNSLRDKINSSTGANGNNDATPSLPSFVAKPAGSNEQEQREEDVERVGESSAQG